MRKLSVSVLSVFFIVLCACAPSKLQKGQMLFDQGDFIASTTMLEQAMVEKPKDEKIKIALSGSKLKFAETLSSEADSTAEHNLPGKIELLEKAKSQIEEAHGLCTDSIAIMDQVKESKKSKQKHIDTYEVLQNNKQEIDSLSATINATLSTTTDKRDQIISEVGALKKRSDKKTNAIKAYKAFKPYTVYDQYMSEVESARVYIYQKCVDRYEALGLAATKKRRYKKAKRYFDASLKVIPNNNQGTAGLLSISAHKEIRKKKYIKAYENLIKIGDIHPQSPFLAKHMSRLKSRLLTQQLKKASRLVATKKAKNYAKSFGIYFMLLDIFKDDETTTAKLNKSVGSLRQKVAGNFTSKALKLSKKNPHKYSAIILDLLANAYSFDSSVADKYTDLAAKMAAYKNLKTNLSVVLYVEPTKGINETLRNRITSEVSSELESEKNQHYSVINPADLSTRKTTDLKMLRSKRVYYRGAESIVYITVVADNLSESGFNSPELKQSEHVSGTKQVHNPKWDEAQRAWQSKQSDKPIASGARDLAKRNCRSKNAFIEMACKATADGIYNSFLRKYESAKYTANNTPEKLTKDAYSTYSYKVYTPTVSGNVKVKYSILDQRTKKKMEVHTLNHDVSAEGRIVEDVRDRDKNNLRNLRQNVPDFDVEYSRAYSAIVQKLASELNGTITAHVYSRFYGGGMKLKKKNAAAAADSFVIFLDDANGQNDKSVKAANKFVAKYIGFTKEEFKKYSVNGEWGFQQADLSDKDITLARQAWLK